MCSCVPSLIHLVISHNKENELIKNDAYVFPARRREELCIRNYRVPLIFAALRWSQKTDSSEDPRTYPSYGAMAPRKNEGNFAINQETKY